ncbi:MAG TPA: FAD:protein FMN transferase [Cellvibrionaceae bacterium]|nr:FAD:protein FMN transferase [Cellvibrionaceae bacterium]
MMTTINPQRLIQLITAGCILALCACSRDTTTSLTGTNLATTYLIEGAAQGTRYHITYVAPVNFSSTQQAALSAAISAELARLDKAISNYRPDSEIEQFNSQITTEPVEVSAEIVKLIEIARSVHKASNGCYDLTIKPLFDLWGFKKNVFTPPSDEALAQTLQLVGMEKLETLDKNHLRKKIPNLRVDLSSIGQGYSISTLAAILEAQAITNYIVEIGGELKARGQKPGNKPWRVALEKPLSNEQKIEKIAVFNSIEPMSMMPSGTYHHYFDADGKRYSHILNARTGKPITHTSASATVLNSDPTLADAWSTALLCLGSQEGIPIANAQGIAALYIDQRSDGFSEQPTQPLINLSTVSFENAKGD